MRILFLSQRFLLPMDTGGKIRTGKLLETLSRHHAITLISNYEEARDGAHRAGIERLCRHFVPVPWREIRRHSPRFYARLAVQMLSRHPVNALNDYSPALERALLEAHAGGEHDVAICDFVQSALLFRGLRGTPRVLFQHNVEAMIPERHMRRARDPVTRAFWWLQWRKMLAYEGACCPDFERVIAVSERDRETFERLYGLDNVHAIPTGVDVELFRPDPSVPERAGSLVFCGSMDWLPNEDGMVHFIEEILPVIRRGVPEATLTVIGRNPSPRLRRLAEGRPEIELTGWVDDTRPHLARGAVGIVPLRIGGGTRMKIYEAMAMGKAIVSTRIGAEGLDVTDGRDIALEDDPEAFAARTVALLRDTRQRRAMGDAARALVEARFSWPRVAEVFQALCEEAAGQPASAPRAEPDPRSASGHGK